MSKEKTMSESSKLYELGFHIVGTIDSNKVADVVDEIKSLITNHHGDIVKEGEVREITLAYTMVKHIAGTNKKFKTAFFDWIKFNADAADMANLKSDLDLNNNILRYLLVKTVDDYEHSTSKLVELEALEAEEESLKEEKEAEIVPEIESTDSEVVNDNKEIDEAIDELVK